MRRSKKSKRRSKDTPKKVAWRWMSRYVRLKGVAEFCKTAKYLSPRDCIAECYTCGKLVNITKGKHGGQAGHFKSRGIGGSSGIYFDERAVRVQCMRCNGFEQGRPEEFREHLVRELGELIVQDLEKLHKLKSRYGPKDYHGLAMYYKFETMKLLKETGIVKWWTRD